jgi:disease resistance protein RPM1
MFLQTLDLKGLFLKECPSIGSLPEQLVRLRLPIDDLGGAMHSNDCIFSLTRLTSLEELSISVSAQQVSWRLPTELRVLKLRLKHSIFFGSEGTEREFWECVRHLNRLEYLSISGTSCMHVTDFVLPSCLRHFAVHAVSRFWKLPSCVNASCLPNLSHLELNLEHMDEHDLKILGMLPELHFLRLELWTWTTATVSSIIVVCERDAALVYFPKLWCCELWNTMLSFHVWNGGHAQYMYLSKPSVSKDN